MRNLFFQNIISNLCFLNEQNSFWEEHSLNETSIGWEKRETYLKKIWWGLGSLSLILIRGRSEMPSGVGGQGICDDSNYDSLSSKVCDDGERICRKLFKNCVTSFVDDFQILISWQIAKILYKIIPGKSKTF